VIDITGLDLTGSSIGVRLDDPTVWAFMSEARFFSGTAPPEPASLTLLGAGPMGFGLLCRKRVH
jgi:hypothetical protein